MSVGGGGAGGDRGLRCEETELRCEGARAVSLWRLPVDTVGELLLGAGSAWRYEPLPAEARPMSASAALAPGSS